MDVDASPRGNREHISRQQQAVRGDHEDVSSRIAKRLLNLEVSQARRLDRRQAQTGGGLGYRRGSQPQAPPPRRTIRLRKNERNHVPARGDCLEGLGGEGGGACEGDAQGRAAQAALRWRFFSFARTRFCLSSDR